MSDHEPKGLGNPEKRKEVHLAGSVIADNDGKILLLHRNKPDSVQWELPGGKLELGETSREATIREAREELGVGVEILGKLGVDRFVDKGDMLIYSWYWVSITEGTPTPDEEGFDRAEYFSWEQIKDMEDQLSANMKNLLKAYENKELKLEIPQS